MTFTAQDDDVRDPDEEIRVSVAHDGHAIGNQSILIRDRQPGPTVEVTFEGVQAAHDAHVAGIARGPFTTRIVFSEPVEGFAQEHINWQTHAGTTGDSTNIGLLLWDFTEVRAGVEYTVEMMPTQDGEVHIGVEDDEVTSVATGDADVVVTVVDDDAASSTQGMLADEALALVNDVTPDEAAAALFGEGDLSDAQLEALDRLGNSNGDYDLGDLLSWVERCRRGEAGCGTGFAGSVSGMTAVRPAAGTGGQGGGTSQRNRGRGDSAARGRKGVRLGVRRIRRRPGRSWYGLALMLVASVTWACADDVVQPVAAEPDPGFLTVRLTAPPSARDLGALLVVEGPGIESVRSPGFEMFQSESTSPLQIVVAGGLSTGPIVQLQVPDRGLHALYRVRLLQVTGEDHSLRDLSEYEVVIGR